jgi:hypothetical protein
MSVSIVYFCHPQLLINVQFSNSCSFLRIIQVLHIGCFCNHRRQHVVFCFDGNFLSSILLEIQGMDKMMETLDNMGIKLCWLH